MHTQLSLCLCGVPKNLNLSRLDLGSVQNAGPTLDSSPEEQLGPDRESARRRELGQTQCGPYTAKQSPHTSDICLQCSFLPTTQLNK